MTADAAPPAPAVDGYSTADAARLLGVSVRRVRQLHASGVLPAVEGEPVPGAPLILDREGVHKEREARKVARKATGKQEGNAAALEVGDLLEVFERMQDRTLETLRAERAEVLAIRDRTEQDLRDALAAERAARDMAERESRRLAEEAEQLRAEVAEARAALEKQSAVPVGITAPETETAEKPRRSWWRRVVDPQ